MSSKIPVLKVGTRDCERAVYGKYSQAQIRAACDRGEIEHERDGADRRRINFASFCEWVKDREKDEASEARKRRAKMDARQNG